MNKKLWIGLLLLSVLSVSSCQRQEETLLLSEDKTKQEESVQEPEKRKIRGKNRMSRRRTPPRSRSASSCAVP
ncbi:hypothetical protein LC724_10345 [Blautia sp. RD014234]|nr:hypothetical protein [Blautia parvula]